MRALQEGFSRDVGTPPMTYLRQVRLRRAHEALRNSMRNRTTVRAAVTSLGFMHMGAFRHRLSRRLFGGARRRRWTATLS